MSQAISVPKKTQRISKKMHIAILGAGFSGLATAWHLLNTSEKIHITLFDPLEIGKGTSGIAAGLIHPYGGPHAKLLRNGWEGWKESLALFQIASSALEVPVATFSGLLRPITREEQQEPFAWAARTYSDIEWIDRERCRKRVEGIGDYSAIFERNAAVVNCPLYLQGLWQASLQTARAQLRQEVIQDLREISHFDQIICAMGAKSTAVKGLEALPLKPIKGQILQLKWPQKTPSLPLPLHSQAYLIMQNKEHCFLGATFERHFSSEALDVEFAKKELLPKAVEMIPALQDALIIDGRVGIRAATPNHLPFVQQLHPNCWAITGMGSKGLLYHALYAKQLAKSVLALK
jgi:glycine/D-amino acid oxidase-like deaminating enzyme